MPDTKQAIDKLTKALNNLFKDRGQRLASVGGFTELPSFNEQKGTWQKGGKYPRYILYLRLIDGQLEAGYFTDSPLKGKLGVFSGVASRGKGVPGVLVRLHLVFIRPDDTYELLTEWEWLVLLLFTQAQVGPTSSEALSNFLPPKLAVHVTNTEVALSSVKLFGLLPKTATITLSDSDGSPVPVTYQEAGEAIQQYLTFDYPAVLEIDTPAAADESEPWPGTTLSLF